MAHERARHHIPDRWLLLFEGAAVVAMTAADAAGILPLSRTPFILLIAWVSLRLRGLPWGAIGLRMPERLARSIAIGIAAGVALELFAVGITTPLIERLTGAPPDSSDFANVVGNLQMLLILIAASWILAAFGEEIAFRGYLMNRVADTLNRTRAAWGASLVLVSIFFGIGHANQGLTGIIQESLSGFWLGLVFLAARRNLTIPIVAHGISNTLAFVLIYLGRYPGLAV